jgi:para-aminobenzoate synthetase/4-amino-4-deoxychorismate lyase
MTNIIIKAGSQRNPIRITVDMDKIKPQIGQVNTNEVVFRDNVEWLYFTDPYQIIRVKKLDDVLPALREIERLIETNGWYAAGFLSYDAAPAFDNALHTHTSSTAFEERAIPHLNSPLIALGAEDFPSLWFGLYPQPRVVSLPKPQRPKEILDWQPTVCPEQYNSTIAKIKELITEGRTYQVNYTMRLQTPFIGEAWEFFLYLTQHQHHQAAYIDTGTYVICSASPELFFQLVGNTITCQPMKGTAPRGRTTAEDQQQSEWLQQSLKNRTENVMIVDMIRNDLGRIAELGSVSVPALFELERYRTLWQMTSTVRAQTGASLAEIFTALFPCASITGAPKVSTMKIIAELENTPRQIYTGTIGYIAPQRQARFNVAIRTALIDRARQRAEYGVGGGIVWDSTSQDEYAEAILKAQVLTQQPPEFSLLETILWTPGEGFFLRQQHVARMLDSADYFDIPITKDNLEEYMQQISPRSRGPQRVRVLLDQAGNLKSETSLLHPFRTTQPLNVCLAKEPINSNNVFMFHKTTRREVYESAQRGLEDFEDVLLYNEQNELTEFTLGNLVVELNGQLFTPPVSCGLLPGTFRAHVLETGQALERTIHLDELAHCTKMFRVNSLRRWQVAALQGSIPKLIV